MKNGIAIGVVAVALMASASSASAQAWRNCSQNSIGPGGCDSILPGGGRSMSPGGGWSILPGGGLSIGPGGGQSILPGGGLSILPGGGLGPDRDWSRGSRRRRRRIIRAPCSYAAAFRDSSADRPFPPRGQESTRLTAPLRQGGCRMDRTRFRKRKKKNPTEKTSFSQTKTVKKIVIILTVWLNPKSKSLSKSMGQ